MNRLSQDGCTNNKPKIPLTNFIVRNGSGQIQLFFLKVIEFMIMNMDRRKADCTKGILLQPSWLIGLLIIFLLDIFWPGIFVVTAISLVARKFLPAILEENVPEATQLSSEK